MISSYYDCSQPIAKSFQSHFTSASQLSSISSLSSSISADDVTFDEGVETDVYNEEWEEEI